MMDPCEICEEPLDSPRCQSCFYKDEIIFSILTEQVKKAAEKEAEKT